MKISMWMIVEKLEKYQPKYSITDGAARITGVRFLSGGDNPSLQPQYVYMSIDGDASPDSSSQRTVLMNGADRIILEDGNPNEILNDLLAVFDFYNSWEAALWEASSHKSFQQIIDLGYSVLRNPMLISDLDGKVLAMSSAFSSEELNEYWAEAKKTRRVPAVLLGAPLHTPDGQLSSWSDTPQIYVLPDGTKTIGAFLSVNGDLIAGFGLWEHKKPILPSDVWLMKILYDVLISTIDAQKQSAILRSSSSILADLLSRVEVDEDLLKNLERKNRRPWQLIVIDNPFRTDVLHKRNLVQRLQTAEVTCVPLLHEDHVVALASANHTDALLNSILSPQEQQYYLIGLSLPFENIRNVPVRYTQTLFTIRQADGKPGIYHAEEFTLQYMLSLFKELNREQCLIHPALNTLKQHDAQKHSELYETLYQYLINERSILPGAQAMHIHKNSFMYRLQRIDSLINVNMDDPMQRTYLLLSYLLEKT